MTDMPFSPRFHFFTKSELHFSKVLAKLVYKKFIVLSKVKLQDAIYHPPVWNLKKEQRAWISKCDRKHIDFLLCDRESTRPLVAIELDGDSHNSDRQKKVDADKSAILKAAQLPLIRVEVREKYET